MRAAKTAAAAAAEAAGGFRRCWPLLLLLVLFPGSFCFSCVCSPSECEEVRDSECPPGAGTVWDSCGCCRVCARIEGEPCGGPYGFYGACAAGLECVVTDLQSDNAEGVCTRTPGLSVGCAVPSRVAGCNIVGAHCRCGQAVACPGDPGFSFRSLVECQMNLAVLLAHAHSVLNQGNAAAKRIINLPIVLDNKQYIINERPCEGLSGNCTDTDCEQEVIASACPPDSIPDPANPAEGGCVCSSKKCLPPPKCTPPATHRLQRLATGEPSNCCDVYECVDPPPVNCSEVVCPSASDGGLCPADSYRLPAHKSAEECCAQPQECQCLPEPCRLPDCQPPLWPKVVRPGNGNPGSCCALFKCVENESNNTCTEENQSWRESECTLCTCKNGLKLCETDPPCPQLPEGCSKTRVPKGKCCPVCLDGPEKPEPDLNGCFTSRGKFIRNGGTWQTDPCTSCTCDHGKRRCVVSVCEPCSNPIYVPGECCPVCHESSVVTLPPNCQAFNCTLRCVHGFVRDSEGCFTCQCQQDECRLECPHGYVKDKQGNKLCECNAVGGGQQCASMAACRKSCAHGFRVNKAGCPLCKCDSCKPLAASDCSKDCAHGFAKNSNGCPICKCMPSPDSRIQSTAVDVVRKSYCFHSDDDVVHEDGEVWFDGCRHCYCRDGTEMCSPLLCPALNCSAHLVNTTGCCPSCPGQELSPKKHMVCGGEEGSSGDLHVEGDLWQLASNHVECTCQDGRTYCHAPPCAPAPCDFQTLVTSSFGCSHCSTNLSNSSLKLTTSCESHPTETVWRESKCVSCLCDDGQAICFEETCQRASCRHPLHIKGRCCPICLDDLSSSSPAPTPQQTTAGAAEAASNLGCLVSVANATARLYKPGDTWTVSDCISCQCLDVGQTLCTKEVCPFTCPNAVKTPGKCCQTCPPSSEGAIKDGSRGALFIVIVSLAVCTLVMLVYVVGRQCRMRRQVKLSAYGCPPPQYHQYKIVTAFEASQAPSIRTTEKSALSPV